MGAASPAALSSQWAARGDAGSWDLGRDVPVAATASADGRTSVALSSGGGSNTTHAIANGNEYRAKLRAVYVSDGGGALGVSAWSSITPWAAPQQRTCGSYAPPHTAVVAGACDPVVAGSNCTVRCADGGFVALPGGDVTVLCTGTGWSGAITPLDCQRVPHVAAITGLPSASTSGGQTLTLSGAFFSESDPAAQLAAIAVTYGASARTRPTSSRCGTAPTAPSSPRSAVT